MNTLERYQCAVCFHLYDRPQLAQECEKQGTPNPDFKIGDKVSYGTEENIGSRWVYSGYGGEIIAGMVILVDGRHQWVYEVTGIFGNCGIVKTEEGWNSPHELAYYQGLRFRNMLPEGKK